MRKLLTMLLCGVGITLYAQVGVNTSLPKSTLDLNKSTNNNSSAEGFLTVRISGDELKSRDASYGVDQNSTVVYVTSKPTVASSKTSNIVGKGFYYYDSALEKWMSFNMPKFFYMPSILFDTTTLGAAEKDLYALYYNQFTNPAVSSTGASGKVPVVGKNDLEYYVTSIDSNVFRNVTIDANGKMNYQIVNNASEATFLNIVFVLK